MTTKSQWLGRVLSGLAIAFLTLDSVMKVIQPAVVVDTTKALGWSADSATLLVLATILLVSTLLYAMPRTALLGAILITGYLGGAVATHMRIGSPLFSHILFGVYVGAIVWAGLWLRSPALRALLPFTSRGES